jgi:prepilin-type N-terminal cleavage/methylation domain-containing protein
MGPGMTLHPNQKVQDDAGRRIYNSGFTIIEVLIVLAIAGLILVVIFLAVPALQRNSRNQQYRNEASRILAGAQEFINNNNTTLPSSAADATVVLNNSNAKSITSLTVVNPGTTTAVTPTLSAATLETGVTCGTVGATTVTPATANAPARSMILIFGVEKNDGTVIAQCVKT